MLCSIEKAALQLLKFFNMIGFTFSSLLNLMMNSIGSINVHIKLVVLISFEYKNKIQIFQIIKYILPNNFI